MCSNRDTFYIFANGLNTKTNRGLITLKITIFGAGYVGVVSAACLLRDGHHVTVVDPILEKVADLNSGMSPLSEPGVAEMLADGHERSQLKATTDPVVGLAEVDMVWVCVGTPSSFDGGLDLTSIDSVFAEIAACLRETRCRPLIVLRSTVLPGTVENHVIPMFEDASGLQVGQDIDIVFHPEFLREGSAVDDFDDPPKIVLGESHSGGGDTLMAIYKKYEAPIFRLELAEAEMVKYCDNVFHAVKVTFANEIGALAKSFDIDARRVADVFCADTKLNISSRYLRPGFAYGGSCLPKDTRALIRKASLVAVSVPLIESLQVSNENQIENFVAKLKILQPTSIGMIGLSFKRGTDDMRESPFVSVAKKLIGEGYSLRIFDPGVDPKRLLGGNKKAVQDALGHLEHLMIDDIEKISEVSHVVINHDIVDSAQVHHWLNLGIKVIDNVGIAGVSRDEIGYSGIAW